MINVHLRAHKLEVQVMNTANTPLMHMLLKTQWAIMRELKKSSLKNLYIFLFPFGFYNKQLLKGNKLSKKSCNKVIWGLGLYQGIRTFFYWCWKYCPNRQSRGLDVGALVCFLNPQGIRFRDLTYCF